jgi:hypothetical protein
MKVAIYSPSKYLYGFSNDDARGFSCVSFRSHLVGVNKPKAVITSGGYHVITDTDICVKKGWRSVERSMLEVKVYLLLDGS